MSLVRPVVIFLAFVGVSYVLTTEVLPLTNVVLVVLFVAFPLLYGVIILRFGGIELEEVMLVLSFEDRFGIDLGPITNVLSRLIG